MSSQPESGMAPPPRRRWPRRLLVAAAAGALLVLFRAPLLRGVGSFLVHEGPGGPAEYVLPLEGAGHFGEAARACKAGEAGKVLLLLGRPGRLHQLGVLPGDEALLREELLAQGVGGWPVEVVRTGAASDWERARGLGSWLQERPQARVTALCHRFGGRRWRWLLDRLLPPDVAARVVLRTIPHPLYDERDWWREK